jgi:hypothetical protein
MKFCLFILSACHSINRNKIEWKRREKELFRTISFHETKYPDLKIFILDSTIKDNQIFYPNLLNRLIENHEFGYSIDILTLKTSSTDICEYNKNLKKLCLKFGFNSFFAIFSGNYLANINLGFYTSCTTDQRFMIHDYDTGEYFLNDEVIFSSSQKSETDLNEYVINDQLVIFNVLKDIIS